MARKVSAHLKIQHGNVSSFLAVWQTTRVDMSYVNVCSFSVLAVFFILGSTNGDDCFDCVQKYEYNLTDVLQPMAYSNNENGYRKRHFFIIIPVGLFVLLCKWCLYKCCWRRRGVIPYRNVQEVTVTVMPETRQPPTSEIMTHHQNLQHQWPQPSLIPLSNPLQPTPFPAPGCVSSTQPTDSPPSYSEACAAQVLIKPLNK